MIITKNAAYLHIQKTAGTWVKDVLKPIALSIGNHDLYDPQLKKDHVFAFVRNPWAWYVSAFNANKYGSGKYIPFDKEVMYNAFPNTPTIQDFIFHLNNPTPLFKKKLSTLYLVKNTIVHEEELISPSMIYIAQTWKDYDCGWYQHICNQFLKHATFVGKTENVREDLLSMLRQSNDLTHEIFQSVLNSPPINVGNIQNDYRQYYNSDLTDLVSKSCKDVIEKFKYTF